MSTNQFIIDTRKKYAEKAQEAVKRHNSGESWDKIAKEYGFNRDCFTDYLESKGLYKKRRTAIPYSNDILDKARAMYEKGQSIAGIAKKFGLHRIKLSKNLQEKYGIKIRQDGRKPLDENYFSSIDTPEKAYWLGFLYADGYVSENNDIEFCLQDKDKKAVESFKKAIRSGHKISEKNVVLNGKVFKNWRLTIKSIKMANDLKKHGCACNKTFELKFPTEQTIPLKFFWHFLRGYTDGDGGICLSQEKITVKYTSASLDFLQAYQLFLDKFDIVSHISKVRDKENWNLSIHCKYAKKLCEYIYQGSTIDTRLKRKYEKYYSYCICRLETKAV